LLSRRAIQESIMEKIDRGRIVVLIAPTSFGKSTLIAKLCEKFRVLDMLPLRSIIKDQLEKMVSTLRADSVGFLASLGEVLVELEGNFIKIEKDPFMLRRGIVATYDSAFLTTLLAPLVEIGKARAHWDVVYYALHDRVVAFDEAHILMRADEAEGGTSKDILPSFAEILAKIGCRVLWTSATIPPPSLKTLLAAEGIDVSVVIIGGNEMMKLYEPLASAGSVEMIDVNEIIRGDKEYGEAFENYVRSVRTLVTDEDTLGLAKRLSSTSLIVVNTVKRAVSAYKELSSLRDDVILIHGRLRRGEKERRIDYVRKKLKGGERVFVVSTQVLEAGVDLGFDAVVSDIATPESVIQRFGRVLRDGKRYPERILLILSISDEAKKSAYSIYPKEIVDKFIERVRELFDRAPKEEIELGGERFEFARIDWRYGISDEGSGLRSIYEILSQVYDFEKSSEDYLSLKQLEEFPLHQLWLMITGEPLSSAVREFEERMDAGLRGSSLVQLVLVRDGRPWDYVEVSSEFLLRNRERWREILGDEIRAWFELYDEKGSLKYKPVDEKLLEDFLMKPMTTSLKLLSEIERKEGVKAAFLGFELRGYVYEDGEELGLI
jgi:CRISPR-associated helicase Cas3